MLVITAKSPHCSTETYYKMVLLLLHEYTYQVARNVDYEYITL